MQRECRSSTASIETYKKSGIALTFRFHKGEETFQTIAHTSAKSMGLERYPFKEGLADLSTPML